MANISRQEGLQATRAKRVDDLELLKAEEEQTIQTNLAETYKAEAEGAQMAASDAAKMAAEYESQAIQAGVQGAANIAQSAVAVGGAATDANSAKLSTSIDTEVQSGKSITDIGNRMSTLIKNPTQRSAYYDKISGITTSAELSALNSEYGISNTQALTVFK